MSYIQTMKDYNVIPPNFNQVFYHKNTIPAKKQEVIQQKLDGEITNTSIELVKFLFERHFATLPQIIRFCDIHGFFYKNGKVNPLLIESHLNELRGKYIINTFFLSTEEQPAVLPIVPEDAQVFYCPAQGSVAILDNYSRAPIFGWDITSMCKASVLISRDLCATQWYLKVLESVKDELIYFRINPEYVIKSANRTKGFTATCDFEIKKSDEIRYFIIEAFRKEDSPAYIREHLANMTSLLCTKSFLKFYPDATKVPNYIIVADTEETLLNLVDETKSTKLNPWWTIDHRLNESFSNGKPFLKYYKDERKFIPTSAKIFLKI